MDKPGWRSLLGILVWVGLLAAIVVLHGVQPPTELSLSDARWSLTGLNPPVVVNPAVSLPHEWRDFSPELRAARYETSVELTTAPAEPLAVYIPSLSMNAAVFVNGARIGDGGSLIEPRAQQSFQPLLFRVPDALLRSGANSIVVELHSAYAGGGFLQQVYLGPQTQLKPYFDLRYALKTQFYIGLIAVVVVIGVIMFGVWWVRRRERVYLLYALSSAPFVSYALCVAAPDLPLSSLWRDTLQWVSILWMIAAITLFTIHFLGLSQPRLARFLGWFSLIAPLPLAALAVVAEPKVFHFVLIHVWLNTVLGFGVYPVWLFARELWRRRDARTFWMFAAGGSILLGGAHDVLFLNGLITPFNGYYYQYSIPLSLVVFTSILGARLLTALRESEILNRELNQRVLAKQAELERSYEELKHSEQQRTLADERERIQRDMHDGLGGTLVSTLAGLDMQGEQDSPAAQSLRSALDDLRLMIYSLDQTSSTLRAALAMLRERLARLAEDAGLELEWNMQDLSAELSLERGVTLQLMRIVQEAFTNTVKHAQAQTFSLNVGEQAKDGRAGVTIEMRDDGRSFDAAVSKSGGYGMSNMRVRAQKIGGVLEIAPAAPGTRITLWAPVG